MHLHTVIITSSLWRFSMKYSPHLLLLKVKSHIKYSFVPGLFGNKWQTDLICILNLKCWMKEFLCAWNCTLTSCYFNTLLSVQASAIGCPQVRKITFTGSTHVGKLLMAAASKTVKKVNCMWSGVDFWLIYFSNRCKMSLFLENHVEIVLFSQPYNSMM